MKAIILAGGRGKRLKQVTDYVPKPLIPLDNIPIIEWQIRYLKKFGIKDIIICTGYKTEQIENYLRVKNNLGVKIRFSKEKVPLGTGGAIKQAAHFINEKSFIVVNGDVITDIDIKKLKHIKFKNIFWYSIDSYKDMEECSKEIKTRKYIKYVAK